MGSLMVRREKGKTRKENETVFTKANKEMNEKNECHKHHEYAN
jgi:hypothetical protein